MRNAFFRRLTDLMRGGQPRDLPPPANAAHSVQRFVGAACLTALTLIAPPQRADALGTLGLPVSAEGDLGTCRYEINLTPTVAWVSVKNDGYYYEVNGADFELRGTGWADRPGDSITSQVLSDVCGFANVTNFVTTRPTASNFTTANFYGVSFRGTRAGEIRDYTVALSGASNTQAVFTNTFVSAAPVVNLPPVVEQIATVNVNSGAQGTVTVVASDPEGATLSYNWEDPRVSVGSAGATGISVTNNVLTFTAPIMAAGSSTRSVTVKVQVADGVNSVQRTITVNFVAPTNTQPTANAGADQTVQSGATVNLTGSGTDADGDTLTYAWFMVDPRTGLPFAITNFTSQTASFIAPTLEMDAQDLSLSVRLTVSDGNGGMNQDTVIITVQSPKNTAPVANAGAAQTVQSGATVNLTASATDADGDTLSYSWADPVYDTDEDPLTIINPTSASASFTAPILDLDGNNVDIPVTLSVSDGNDGFDESTVIITVVAPKNTPPTANAGQDQIVQSGDLVKLSGEAGDAESSPNSIFYYWTIKSNPPPAPELMDHQRLNSSFTAPVLALNAPDLVLTATLTVIDGNYVSTTDDVTIRVQSPKTTVPTVTATAAETTVQSGAVVNLTGTAVDPDGDTMTYLWTSAGGTITNATTLNPTITVRTLALNANDKRVRVILTVTDSKGGITTREAFITVQSKKNEAPTVTASSSVSGTTVTLSAVGADPDAGDTAGLTYQWTQTKGTRVTLSATNIANPTFTMPTVPWFEEANPLVFQVRVTDDDAVGATQDVTVNLVPSERPALTASAGADQSVKAGDTVQLVGTLSGDPASVAEFSWSVNSEDVTITNGRSLNPSFIAPDVDGPTSYTFTLIVTEYLPNREDRAIRSFDDTVVITVGRAGPTEQETVAAVTSFTQTRINNLIALQPDLLSIIGGADGAANLTVSSRGGQVDLSTAPDANVWARLKGNWSTVDTSKSDYVLGSIGTHTTFANGMVLGAMAQIDHMETKSGEATLTGTGYLVGPYFVSKFADQPITMQGRLLYGKSKNEYSPLGTFVDQFDSTRLMGQFGVSGQIQQGTTVWKPNLQAAFAREQTSAYTDGAGTDVAATDTSVGQVAAGLDVTFPLPVQTGGLTATLGLTNIWTNGMTGGDSAFDGHRAKISAGINREFAKGTTLSLTASYDGLGTRNFESIALDLLFQHRF